ncbi:MAG: pyridoxamine 5'-phosphate oxidase family protein [Pseudomonadota bacterium]
MYIESEEQLRELYGFPKGRAKDKQLAALERHSINFIEHSPFVLISTHSQSGSVDCSPRGGEPGFVKVIDESRIVLPDGKGNNRLDSLVNIIETADIGCLFLIPGVDETLRVNGRARISKSSDYLTLFAGFRNPPRTCIEINVEEVFLHCAKALMRSRLWSVDAQIERSSFPTIGTMLNDQLSINEVAESQEEMVARYQHDL